MTRLWWAMRLRVTGRVALASSPTGTRYATPSTDDDVTRRTIGASATQTAMRIQCHVSSPSPASGSLIATMSAAAASRMLATAPQRASVTSSITKKLASKRTSRLA